MFFYESTEKHIKFLKYKGFPVTGNFYYKVDFYYIKLNLKQLMDKIIYL